MLGLKCSYVLASLLLSSLSVEQAEARCGDLGGVCSVKLSCNGGKGICKTRDGCIDRSKCSGPFNDNDFFDHCECTPPGDEKILGIPGKWLVMLCTLAGIATLIMVWRYTSVFEKLGKMLNVPACGKKALLPLGVASFYSLSSYAFTLFAGTNNDFFTNGTFTFIILILCAITVLGGIALTSMYGLIAALVGLTWSFCCMAGYFAFTFCVFAISIAALALFILMSVVIRVTKDKRHSVPSGSNDEIGADETAKAACRIFLEILRRIVVFVPQLTNFVLQSVLVAYAIGEVDGLREELRETLRWSFSFPSLKLPDSLRYITEAGASLSAAMNEVGEQFSDFMLGYSNIWTPNPLVAFTTVGVFEIAVVVAVFGVVLSDVMLVMSARHSVGIIGRVLSELLSRGILYVLQTLVSASAVLLLALFRNNIDRPAPDDSQQFFYNTAAESGNKLTMVYIVLVLLLGAYLLFNLWSGRDAGMHNVALKVMQYNGVNVDLVASGRPKNGIFIAAFFGYWSRSALEAFEIDQRAEAFHLSRSEVMLATVNTLSFPLYILPFGAIPAKLGEYLNQCPAYVADRRNGCYNIWLSLTYLAEYILVVRIAAATVEDASMGGPEATEVAEQANSAKTALQALFGFLGIMLFRLLVILVRDHCSCPSSANSEEGAVSEVPRGSTPDDFEKDDDKDSSQACPPEDLGNSNGNDEVVLSIGSVHARSEAPDHYFENDDDKDSSQSCHPEDLGNSNGNDEVVLSMGSVHVRSEASDDSLVSSVGKAVSEI